MKQWINDMETNEISHGYYIIDGWFSFDLELKKFKKERNLLVSGLFKHRVKKTSDNSFYSFSSLYSKIILEAKKGASFFSEIKIFPACKYEIE